MVPLRQSILSGPTGALCTDSEAGSKSAVFGLDKWQPLALLALTLEFPSNGFFSASLPVADTQFNTNLLETSVCRTAF
jgi:hypothetical protein